MRDSGEGLARGSRRVPAKCRPARRQPGVRASVGGAGAAAAGRVRGGADGAARRGGSWGAGRSRLRMGRGRGG